MTAPRFKVGLDENGLGPRLGFMTVTGVTLAVTATDTAFHRVTASVGIGDSKSLCAHGAMSEVESLVLALLADHLNTHPKTLNELVAALSLHDAAWLRAPCPSGEAPVACFGSAVPLPAFGPGVTDAARATASTLRAAGVVLHGARTALVCPQRLNAGRRDGRSRFDIDLDMMIELFVALRRDAPEGTVTCGKVGGRKRYADALMRVSPLIAVLEEVPARSSYRVPGIGTVDFVMDCDATHPEVALASLIGKYLRELTMERSHRYYAHALPDLARVSGYHDPNTARFVAATEILRRERGISDGCFER